MDVKELETAFDAAVETLFEAGPGDSPLQKQIILMGAMLLKEFLVDHKRAADALEKISQYEDVVAHFDFTKTQ